MAWNDESNPAQGFKYLYLSSGDYEALEKGSVIANEVMEGGEKRYALTDIIGQVCLVCACVCQVEGGVCVLGVAVVGAVCVK